MTIAMDHKVGKRKGSWDSKISVSTVSTRHFGRSDTPSSILSSDSDIRFTRKLGGQYRCGCYIVASFLLFLLVAAIAIYFGYTFLATDPPADQIFRATFRVVDGDYFTKTLSDPSTDEFRYRARDYKERLNLLFRRSHLRRGFLGTEVLALDGDEDQDLVVHFNLHFDPRWLEVHVPDLITVMAKEIQLRDTSVYLRNLTIDPASLDVKESSASLTTPFATSPRSTSTSTATTEPLPPRHCEYLQLEYCKHQPYNRTSYPNKLGHRSIKDVRDNVIAFRELVDAECYNLAYEFVCQLMQPACLSLPEEAEDHMILPCRSFCKEFYEGCGNRLPERYKHAFDCDTFPEYSGPGSCNPEPGCTKELQRKSLSSRICDGTIDCFDLSDELSCSYCQDKMHCGTSETCISRQDRCDGKEDCPNGSDERGCLTVAPSLSLLNPAGLPSTPFQHQYFSEGYVIFNEKGSHGKVCMENLNTTVPEYNHNTTLWTIATSLCTVLGYGDVMSVDIVKDNEDNIKYVKMEDPTAAEITFIRSSCPSRNVLYVSCDNLRCGIQTLRPNGGVEYLSKMADHGDWPWHGALFKDGVHVCDGTLISDQWILTTASCFQGQPKAQWIVRLGSIRLSSESPWQQERAIIGMVKSPVEGSTIVMAKLDQPVSQSDFVQSICLPEEDFSYFEKYESYCNTLGWTRNKEQLQRIDVTPGSMQSCENISIPTVNSFCAEPHYLKNDCNEEELAGSPMLCLLPDNRTWTLVGISNWRIACSNLGTERPRMYDKITSNIKWIYKTMSALP